CPVYSRTGGHAYGSGYPGPIGAILTPQLVRVENAPSLPFASGLCGACYQVCPVKLDIPSLLLHLRAKAAKPLPGRPATRAAGRAGLRRAGGPSGGRRRRALGRRLGRLVQRPLERAGVLAGWPRTRDLRQDARESFRDWWSRERGT